MLSLNLTTQEMLKMQSEVEMDTNLRVRRSVWSSHVVGVEVADQVEVVDLVVVAAAMVVVVVDVVLLHGALSTVSWSQDCLPLVAGRISRTICERLVMFSLPTFSKMELVLWNTLVMMT